MVVVNECSHHSNAHLKGCRVGGVDRGWFALFSSGPGPWRRLGSARSLRCRPSSGCRTAALSGNRVAAYAAEAARLGCQWVVMAEDMGGGHRRTKKEDEEDKEDEENDDEDDEDEDDEDEEDEEGEGGSPCRRSK